MNNALSCRGEFRRISTFRRFMAGLQRCYRALSLSFLGWVMAWIVLAAGYNAWRAYHLKLIPKLEVVSIYTVETPTNSAPVRRKFVQALGSHLRLAERISMRMALTSALLDIFKFNVRGVNKTTYRQNTSP
jgi:hypothetical protein